MIKILESLNKRLTQITKLDFFRDFYPNLKKDTQVIWIVGERWIGKTTALLQYAKTHKNSFYFSADNSIVLAEWLFHVAFELLEKYSIDHLMIDEIHTYPNWIQELKNIIDSFPDKKIIFSWSSSLDIVKWTVSLERRVKVLKIYPLSFKEFLDLNYWIKVDSYSFEDIISNYKSISFLLKDSITKEHMNHFLQTWFYPYAKNINKADFYAKIFNTVEKIILEDLPSFMNSQTLTLTKVKKIFYFIANTLPWDLNYSNLSKKIWVHPDTLENIIYILSKIGIINLLPKSQWVTDLLRKEFKIYLWNPNLYYSYNQDTNIGIIRESFVLHFLKKIINAKNEITVDLSIPKSWDIHLHYNKKQYLFEIWWKNKTDKQLGNKKNSFIIADNIIIWEGRKIPLWLFWLIKE
jgi:predicted AAA+ superfamily ATPase